MIDEQPRCQNPSCGLPIASIEDLPQARGAAHLKLQMKRGQVKQEIPLLKSTTNLCYREYSFLLSAQAEHNRGRIRRTKLD
jgi:hypothetical protein